MQDQKTISNEYHEILLVARKFNIQPSEVYRVKEECDTNDRETIYKIIFERLEKGLIKTI